jgi:GTPase
VQYFVDETDIEVSSGAGGNGAVSFRREKYVPRGGPDGGDGGKGGNVIFQVKNNLKTLAHLKNKKFYRAKNGSPGTGKKKHGKNGEPEIIDVPPGTIIKDKITTKIIKDLCIEGETWVMFEGGRGGLGNSHFATSRRQAPKFAQPGEEGKSKVLTIELNLIADIGFVGFPNAGKSSLLAKLTNAHPKVGAYAFTTKVPNLGVMQHHSQEIVLADIPGLIEGASSGSGLGIRFLKHIARTTALAFLVDLSDDNYRNAIPVLEEELRTFSCELAKKQRLIIGNKLDIPGTIDAIDDLKNRFPNDTVLGISALSGEGLNDLKLQMIKLVKPSSENGEL